MYVRFQWVYYERNFIISLNMYSMCLVLLIILYHFISVQDPTSALLQLAEQSGMAQRFHALSLGQGQAPIATRMIKEGVREVFEH